jgi:hypothetical protein
MISPRKDSRICPWEGIGKIKGVALIDVVGVGESPLLALSHPQAVSFPALNDDPRVSAIVGERCLARAPGVSRARVVHARASRVGRIVDPVGMM